MKPTIPLQVCALGQFLLLQQNQTKWMWAPLLPRAYQVQELDFSTIYPTTDFRKLLRFLPGEEKCDYLNLAIAEVWSPASPSFRSALPFVLPTLSPATVRRFSPTVFIFHAHSLGLPNGHLSELPVVQNVYTPTTFPFPAIYNYPTTVRCLLNDALQHHARLSLTTPLIPRCYSHPTSPLTPPHAHPTPYHPYHRVHRHLPCLFQR